MKKQLLKVLSVLCVLTMLVGMGAAFAEGTPALTIWAGLNAKSAVSVKSNADILSIQETEKATGIHVDFIEPPVGEESSQFNLLIASGDYPDMIAWNWWNYPGGPGKAISDEILIDLTPYLEEYAPALTALFEQYPLLKKQCTTDEGQIYFFPRINGDVLNPEYRDQAFWVGPIYRADILEALGLEEPKTLDDWYNVLTAVKEKYPDMIPFAAAGATTANTSLYCLASAFGARPNYFMDNGTVSFGLLSPNFKNFVTTMAKWYEEELIDPDFLANAAGDLKTKVTSGEVFAFIGAQGGNYVSYSQIMKTSAPDAQLKIAPWPTGPDGKSYTSQAGVVNTVNGGFGIGITTACKDVETALRYLDYGYTEEGIMINNWGVEGLTYQYDENGNIQWTPQIEAEIAASTFDNVMGKYFVTSISTWASYCDPRTHKLFRTYPGQYEAGQIWAQASADLDMPPLTPTTDESSQVATITNNVTTYRDEMVGNMIMGLIDIEEYDSMVDEAKAMGIEEAVAIYNAALARYNER